jgi:hypothetical protein
MLQEDGYRRDTEADTLAQNEDQFLPLEGAGMLTGRELAVLVTDEV